MYPFRFKGTDTLERIETTIPNTYSMSAVIYATGTPGLEGLLAGVPTFRLMLTDMVALDIMPEGITAHAVTSETLSSALIQYREVSALEWRMIMAPVDFNIWRYLLTANDQESIEQDFEDEANGMP